MRASIHPCVLPSSLSISSAVYLPSWLVNVMNLAVYLSVCFVQPSFLCVAIDLFMDPSINPSMHASIHPSHYPSIHLSIHASIHPYTSISLSNYLSDYLAICLSSHLSIYPSSYLACLYRYLPMSKHVCLSVVLCTYLSIYTSRSVFVYRRPCPSG